jgi:hypothetical protein
MNKQYELIQPLKDIIVKHVPRLDETVTDERCYEAIERWELGEIAKNPLEAGVFEMCEQVKREVKAAK